MRHSRRSVVVSALCAVVLAMGSATFAQELDVEATVVEGTRSHSLKTLTGSDLTAISFGNTAEAGFLTTVNDVMYDRTGYQLNAVLSDLYFFDGEFTCGTKIASEKLSLGFLANPVSVGDVAALVAPLWDLNGTLAGIDLLLDDVVVDVTGLVGENLETLLDGVFTGVEDTLPIKVAPGAGGAFTAPGPHTACNPAPASPTTHALQMGEASNETALFDWVTDEIEALVGATPTASDLLAAGGVTEEALTQAVRDALATAGVDLGLLDLLILADPTIMGQIFDQLDATLQAITSLIGQSGLYASLPKLVIDLDGTGGGTYRGTMTVTLVDVP